MKVYSIYKSQTITTTTTLQLNSPTLPSHITIQRNTTLSSSLFFYHAYKIIKFTLITYTHILSLVVSRFISTDSMEKFDGEAGSILVNELNATFASGKTQSYEWRISQLNQLSKLLNFHEQEIVDALRNDIDKPPLETVAYEVGFCSVLFASIIFYYSL
jgi:hypothetical protein